MVSPQKHNPISKNILKHLRRHSVGMLGFFLLTIASFLIAADTDAATGINDQISFQGKVVNTNGTNVANGNYDFVFQLYTVSSGGTNIWTETWNSGTSQVTVTDGIFQVNLGTYTDLPGSVDFNTDNIYLGINFNADGEMSPRVHFTAAPYAFNAQKVGGLTVTDTTGTLTIPNSETISFGGSFSTTASNDIALTTSGTTTLTLPTTGTLATLSGTEEFTNKAIGSTGLTFSGATTDITTASGESLVIVANGAGVIDLQDATTVDSLTTDTGGISIAAGQSYTGAGAVSLSSAATTALTVDSGTTGTLNFGTGNNAKTISLGTGTAGNTINIATDNTTSDTINIGSVLDNVAITGDQWSITDAGVLTVASCSGCGGGGGDLQTTYGADADGSNATISLTAADDGLVFTNPSSGGNNLSAFVLQVSQQHTTDAIAILDLVQSSNAANGVNLTANSIDGETGLAITANGLTAGSGLTVASSSTAFTGSLAGITLSGSDAANTGNVFAVSNTGTANANTSLFVQHNATGTDNLAVRVNDVASDSTPFVIDGTGNVGVGTAAPSRVMDIFQAASAPQLRLSKDLTNYSEFTVDSTGDLQLAATGTDIRALSENLWVCDNDACPALTLTGDGNIFIENVLKFGNGVYMKNDSATELGVYDNDDQAMLIFDEL